MEYTKNEYVKSSVNGHCGKVCQTSYREVTILDAVSGYNDYIKNSDVLPATKEEYDAQRKAYLNLIKEKGFTPQPTTTPAPTLARPVAMTQPSNPVKTYRWLCLECGATYNGHECPTCGGDDRTVNSGKDFDRSYLGN